MSCGLEQPLFTRTYYDALYFLAMTKIVKDGIYLDPDLYIQLGSPGMINFFGHVRDLLLVPSVGHRVTQRNNKPFLSTSVAERKLIRPGTYEAKIVHLFTCDAYVIEGAAIPYSESVDERFK